MIANKGGMPLENRFPYKAGSLHGGVPNTPDLCNTTRLLQFKKNSEGENDFQVYFEDYITN